MTLIELLMTLILISITSVAAIDVVTDSVNEARFSDTKAKLVAIRKAMVGDPSLTALGVRSNFGFLGDIGSIPSGTLMSQAISALLINPALPVYAVDSSSRIGLGWNGPYLSVPNSSINYTIDGWGNDFVYNPTAVPPTVVSYGADGVAGGTGFDQDITMELPTNMTTATVYGVIIDSSNSLHAPTYYWNGTAEVDLNEPTSGALPDPLPTTTVVAVDNGAFSFTGVPLGIRSVTIYIPSKAAPTQTPLGPIVFSVTGANYLIPPKMLDLGL